MRRLERVAWRAAQASCLAVAALGAGVVLTEPASATGTVAYRLAWATDGVERLGDGSWRVVTADGHEVVVVAGELVTRSLTLVACPHDHDHDLLAEVAGLLSADVAWAGHGGDTDPLAVAAPVTEDLLALGTTDVATASTTDGEPSYCEAHTAVAGGSAAAAVSGTSPATLHVEAVVDGEPVVVDTSVAWGWRTPLAGPVELDRSSTATVEVRRSAAALAEALATGDATDVLRALAGSSTAASTSSAHRA